MLIDFPLKQIPNQPKENYYGNKEYKLILDNDNEKIIEKRASQMLFRIYEGNGITKYFIGIEDDGKAIGIKRKDIFKSIVVLNKIISKINANLKKIRFYKGTNGYIFVAHIDKKIKSISLDLNI